MDCTGPPTPLAIQMDCMQSMQRIQGVPAAETMVGMIRMRLVQVMPEGNAQRRHASGRGVANRAYQHTIAVPHVSPAPKPLNTILLPGLTRSSAIASSSASGTEPADVLP